MSQIYNRFNPYGYQPFNYQEQPNPNYQRNNIKWVQGIEGAKSFFVAPNNTVDLWDSEAPVIYLKSADSAGMPSMKILDYTIRDNTPKNVPILAENEFATKEDINMLQNEINEFKGQIEALTSNKRTVKKEVVKVE